MNKILAALALILTLACGGGGGGTPAVPPSLANFLFSPASAIQNDGNGAIQVAVSIDFTTPGGDGATLRVSQGTQSQDLPLSGMQGQKSGQITGYLTMATTEIGAYTFQVQLLTTGGTPSNTLSQTFTVTAPPATLLSLTPASAVIGSPVLTLTANGTGFQATSQVLWNGTPVTTAFISSTALQAQIPASAFTALGTAEVSVNTPGTGLTTVLWFTIMDAGLQVVALPTNDIVWDPTRQVLYASIPSSAGSQGNSIAVIDPVAGRVTRTVFAGSEPHKLAIADDGSCLYAGIDGAATVQRFLLPNLTPDITLPLGTGLNGVGPNRAYDIQVAPGAPHTVAVAMGNSNVSIGFTGLSVYDDATARATAVPGWGTSSNLMDSIQWGMDGTVIYAQNSEDTAWDFYTLAVDAAGVTVLHDYPATFTSFRAGIHLDRGNRILYADTGQILDPATGQRLGIFNANGPMVPDSGLGMAIFLDSSTFYGSTYTLKSYDLTHFTPTSTLNFPVTALGSGYGSGLVSPNRVIRWGGNGIAIGGGGTPLYLLSGPFILGQ